MKKKFYTPHIGCIQFGVFLLNNSSLAKKLNLKTCPQFIEDNKTRYVKVVYEKSIEAYKYWLNDEDRSLTDNEIISKYPRYEEFLYTLDVNEGNLISEVDKGKYLVFIN